MSDDTTMSIETQAAGPYLVKGNVPLRRVRRVETTAGEPVAWQTVETHESQKNAALCRCGQSSNKPFCDGTHSDAEVDLQESAPRDSYADRAEALGGDPVTVVDDRTICEHAGFCGNERSNIWEMAAGDTDGPTAQLMAGMVEHCPSGALTYRVGDEQVEADLEQGIGVIEDGPLWVTGGIPVTRADGEPFETRNRMTLCRCGASGIKPLCDGSHADIGWSG
ncbi:CDGSH iron-sulfur domain-containing protein [Euzebya tangerina]|uniref:CDGSH iron-sulfur domain-containing protein n=1 Tax=Euzebya tangerina TaxID=591198 RepID=UPI000E31E40E|nr:CDGSH iron-sulfur domain-containing protein [Euzebya tangerina]